MRHLGHAVIGTQLFTRLLLDFGGVMLNERKRQLAAMPPKPMALKRRSWLERWMDL